MNEKLQNSNIEYLMCYFLDLNIRIILKKIDLDVFLSEICNNK